MKCRLHGVARDVEIVPVDAVREHRPSRHPVLVLQGHAPTTRGTHLREHAERV